MLFRVSISEITLTDVNRTGLIICNPYEDVVAVFVCVENVKNRIVVIGVLCAGFSGLNAG
jgi:hypothetical protein